jgi:hypothetical protein
VEGFLEFQNDPANQGGMLDVLGHELLKLRSLRVHKPLMEESVDEIVDRPLFQAAIPLIHDIKVDEFVDAGFDKNTKRGQWEQDGHTQAMGWQWKGEAWHGRRLVVDFDR